VDRIGPCIVMTHWSADLFADRANERPNLVKALASFGAPRRRWRAGRSAGHGYAQEHARDTCYRARRPAGKPIIDALTAPARREHRPQDRGILATATAMFENNRLVFEVIKVDGKVARRPRPRRALRRSIVFCCGAERWWGHVGSARWFGAGARSFAGAGAHKVTRGGRPGSYTCA
jgi:hypothetical protein